MVSAGTARKRGGSTLHTSPSSRGLGRGPFKAETRVRIPVGTPASAHECRRRLPRRSRGAAKAGFQSWVPRATAGQAQRHTRREASEGCLAEARRAKADRSQLSLTPPTPRRLRRSPGGARDVRRGASGGRGERRGNEAGRRPRSRCAPAGAECTRTRFPVRPAKRAPYWFMSRRCRSRAGQCSTAAATSPSSNMPKSSCAGSEQSSLTFPVSPSSGNSSLRSLTR